MFEANDNSKEEAQHSNSNKHFTVPGWVKKALSSWAGTALSGMMAVLVVWGIYLMGVIHYTAYLAYFGIYSNTFPLTRDVYQAYGLILVRESPRIFIGKIFLIEFAVIAAIAASILMTCLLVIATKALKHLPTAYTVEFRKIIYLVFDYLLKTYIFIIIFSFAISIIIGPSYAAQEIAQNMSIRDEGYFNEGLSNKKYGHPFVFLKENVHSGGTVRKNYTPSGFLIAHSETHVALYCNHRTEEYQLEGYHLEIDLDAKDVEEKNKPGTHLAVCSNTID